MNDEMSRQLGQLMAGFDQKKKTQDETFLQRKRPGWKGTAIQAIEVLQIISTPSTKAVNRVKQAEIDYRKGKISHYQYWEIRSRIHGC